MHGTRHIIDAVRGTSAQVVSFSTDYVFDGRKGAPYVEHDEPGPLNAYGRTKLAQEHETLAWAHGTVIRTAWLFSATGRNFVTTILAAARERAAATDRGAAAGRRRPGRFADLRRPPRGDGRRGAGRAASGPASTTWPGAAPAAGASWPARSWRWPACAVAVEPITTAQAGRPAPRPAFSALATERAHTAAALLAGRRGGRHRRAARHAMRRRRRSRRPDEGRRQA